MKIANTLLATAAIAVLSTAAIAAEGAANTDGTHGAYNTQTDTHVSGSATAVPTPTTAPSSHSESASEINKQASPDHTAANVSMDAQTIQSVQASLRNEGHSVSVDGVWGPRTAAALRDFQRDNSLSATGTLNAETLAALNVSN